MPSYKFIFCKFFLTIVLITLLFDSYAQTDTTSIVIHKDPRVDLLIKKQIQINEETTREARSHVPGYRIQVMNSPDRNKVFAAKTKVNQDYPELKSYLIYQAPNYKLKLGNFKTEEDADPYMKKLSKSFPTGVYLTHDIIDIKIDKPESTN
ncbi:MAG: SPOR domain-containing protein [Bacteroidetes bacterium]|nr:SPOR domain-containing protein [Bacteroidota bacterium]